MIDLEQMLKVYKPLSPYEQALSIIEKAENHISTQIKLYPDRTIYSYMHNLEPYTMSNGYMGKISEECDKIVNSNKTQLKLGYINVDELKFYIERKDEY